MAVKYRFTVSVYICKVGMPPSHPLIFSFYPREWVNC